jgi:hypothetical protein
VYLGDIIPLVTEAVDEGILEIVEARRWGPATSDLTEELTLLLGDNVSRRDDEIRLLGD